METRQSPVGVKPTSVYSIIACNAPDELSEQVSAALKDGSLFLHGQPFVFKDQICQAVKSVNHG
jgi:hypothetical protein